jgi:sigma-54 specific flagellar transcriptional regulator A
VTEYEKELILGALEKTKWVKNKAAELLQIKRTTLVEKIKRYGIEKKK